MIVLLDARLDFDEQIALKNYMLDFVKRVSSGNYKSEAELQLLPQIITILTNCF